MFKKVSAAALAAMMLLLTPCLASAQQQWQKMSPPVPFSVGTVPPPTYLSLSPNFSNDNTLFMATGGALYESKNGGTAWTGSTTPGTSTIRQDNLPLYGSDSTLRTPTAKMFVAPDFDTTGLVAVSTTGSLYATNVDSGSATKFFIITPQPPSSLQGNPKYAPGFAFGPNESMYAAAGPYICYGRPDPGNYDLAAWSPLYYTGCYTYNIKLSPEFASDRTMIIQNQKGVFVSTDGGNDFTKTMLPIADGCYDIEFSSNYSSDGTIAVAVPVFGIFLSTDRGATWKNIFTQKGVTALALSANGAIYAGMDSAVSSAKKGIYVSWDKGDNWTNIGPEKNIIAGLYAFPIQEGDILYAFNEEGLDRTTVSQPAVPVTTGSQPPSSVVFVIGQQSYTADGQVYNMDVAPFNQDGRIYVPLRYLSNALGVPDSNINWDDSTQTVTISTGKIKAKFVVGSTTYTVDDKAMTSDVAPLIRDGRVCLPVRYVAQALGYQVQWNPSTETVTLSK